MTESLLWASRLDASVARELMSANLGRWPSGHDEHVELVSVNGFRRHVRLDGIYWEERDNASADDRDAFRFELELTSIASHPMHPWPQRFGHRFMRARMREEGGTSWRVVYRQCDIIRTSSFVRRWSQREQRPPSFGDLPYRRPRHDEPVTRLYSLDEVIYRQWSLSPYLHRDNEQWVLELEDWQLVKHQIISDGPGLRWMQPWSVGWSFACGATAEPTSAFTGAALAAFDVVNAAIHDAQSWIDRA